MAISFCLHKRESKNHSRGNAEPAAHSRLKKRGGYLRWKSAGLLVRRTGAAANVRLFPLENPPLVNRRQCRYSTMGIPKGGWRRYAAVRRHKKSGHPIRNVRRLCFGLPCGNHCSHNDSAGTTTLVSPFYFFVQPPKTACCNKTHSIHRAILQFWPLIHRKAFRFGRRLPQSIAMMAMLAYGRQGRGRSGRGAFWDNRFLISQNPHIRGTNEMGKRTILSI